MNNEFETDHKIDPHQLDVEATLQAERFFKWAKRAVEAKVAVDKTKFKMEVVEAQLQLAVRKDPDKYNLPKVTEATINATVKEHPEYRKAVKKWHQAREESAMLDKAVMAMEMKKRMLEALITLHGQQYFAGPSSPRNLGEAWLMQQEQAEKTVNKRPKKRKRKRVK